MTTSGPLRGKGGLRGGDGGWVDGEADGTHAGVNNRAASVVRGVVTGSLLRTATAAV